MSNRCDLPFKGFDGAEHVFLGDFVFVRHDPMKYHLCLMVKGEMKTGLVPVVGPKLGRRSSSASVVSCRAGGRERNHL